MSRSILVADNDPEIRDVVRIYLKNEGYRVLEAEDGAGALDYVGRSAISCS